MDGRHHAEDVRPRQRQRKAYEKKSDLSNFVWMEGAVEDGVDRQRTSR